jgi:hypothetical protein
MAKQLFTVLYGTAPYGTAGSMRGRVVRYQVINWHIYGAAAHWPMRFGIRWPCLQSGDGILFFYLANFLSCQYLIRSCGNRYGDGYPSLSAGPSCQFLCCGAVPFNIKCAKIGERVVDANIAKLFFSWKQLQRGEVERPAKFMKVKPSEGGCCRLFR